MRLGVVVLSVLVLCGACAQTAPSDANQANSSAAATNSNASAVSQEEMLANNNSFRIFTPIPKNEQTTIGYTELVGAENIQEGDAEAQGRVCKVIGYECEYVDFCCGATKCERVCRKKTCRRIIECEPSCGPKQPC